LEEATPPFSVAAPRWHKWRGGVGAPQRPLRTRATLAECLGEHLAEMFASHRRSAC